MNLPKQKKIDFFDGPYGRIKVAVKEKPNKDDSLLFPYYDDPDPNKKSIHHHLYFDSKRKGVMGIAYHSDITNSREYWIDDGYGWQRYDDYDFKIFLKNIVNVAVGMAILPARIRQEKEEICREAEKLSESTNWKQTADALKELQAKYKVLGFTGRESDNQFWNRLKSAVDNFYQRRKQHFERLDFQREKNRKQKEALCKEAEYKSHLSDWKVGNEAFKKLRERWKQIGTSGKEHEDSLWKKFCAAQDKFYERRNQFYQQNLHRKERLCIEAEKLTPNQIVVTLTGQLGFGDVKSAIKRVKELQEEWKQVGAIPREENDKVWKRFKYACDSVFQWADKEKKRKQHEWHLRMMQVLDRKRSQYAKLRESISHDETVLSRTNNSYDSVRPGRRAEEIRESLRIKIKGLEAKISSKKSRLDEIDASIRDIQSKI